MKKIVLTIYHTGVPAYLIRIMVRLIAKMSPEVKIIEVMETETDDPINSK